MSTSRCTALLASHKHSLRETRAVILLRFSAPCARVDYTHFGTTFWAKVICPRTPLQWPTVWRRLPRISEPYWSRRHGYRRALRWRNRRPTRLPLHAALDHSLWITAT